MCLHMWAAHPCRSQKGCACACTHGLRTRAGANGAHEVRNDGQRADAHAAERRRDGDVPVQLLLERLYRVAVALRIPMPSFASAQATCCAANRASQTSLCQRKSGH